MPRWLDDMAAMNDAMKFAPLHQRTEFMLGRYTPPPMDFGYKPLPTVILDSHNVAVMNSNGDWEKRDPTGRRTGELFTSRAPNPVMSTIFDLEPKQKKWPSKCSHGRPHSEICFDCGRYT